MQVIANKTNSSTKKCNSSNKNNSSRGPKKLFRCPINVSHRLFKIQVIAQKISSQVQPKYFHNPSKKLKPLEKCMSFKNKSKIRENLPNLYRELLCTHLKKTISFDAYISGLKQCATVRKPILECLRQCLSGSHCILALCISIVYIGSGV